MTTCARLAAHLRMNIASQWATDYRGYSLDAVNAQWRD